MNGGSWTGSKAMGVFTLTTTDREKINQVMSFSAEMKTMTGLGFLGVEAIAFEAWRVDLAHSPYMIPIGAGYPC
ncbi:hypothetical protein Q1695_009240 [Nippostrongylus brasiliensis]|nr:hypothetical protein Q1695_009240 [Nippostrongylus brasiliensis]